MKTGFYRQGKQIIEWSKEDGSKLEAYVEHHPSSNAAKRRSRELQKRGTRFLQPEAAR